MGPQSSSSSSGACEVAEPGSMAVAHFSNRVFDTMQQFLVSFSALIFNGSMDHPSSSSIRGQSLSVPLLSSSSVPITDNTGGINVWVSCAVGSVILLSVLLLFLHRHVSKFHHEVPKTSISTISMARGSFTPLIQQQEPTTASGNNHDDLSTNTIERVHVIILVHGWLGCPQDLAYIHHAIQRQAAAIAVEQQSNNNHNDSREQHQQQQQQQKQHDPFVIHTCVANKHRTNDGIQAGADRIAVEIQDVLDGVLAEYQDVQEITFSMLGFSLGGLYARVVLPQILPPLRDPSDNNNNDNDNNNNQQLPKITPKLFCTMATPHLGSRGHTFFYMPAFLERAISRVVPTGRDLFHHTPLLQQTVTDPKWTEPLLRFEKRIAYANSYGMDMMVPTTTAAFLSKSNTGAEQHVIGVHENRSYKALVVETKAQHEVLHRNEFDHSLSSLDDVTMAQRLDAMGWTKVFVDYTNSYRPPSPQSTTKTSYRSAELISEFHRRKRRRFHLPVGHDLMPVNSKNAFLSYANRRGRPLVDQMATDFIHDVVHGSSSR